MSNFSVDLNDKRECRYVFPTRLWNNRLNRFDEPVDVLLDTGSFNTAIHKSLATRYGTILDATMKVAIGGFRGDVNICVINKLKVGTQILEKVVALAVPFSGELKDHILLGANVTNNWKFTVSRVENKLDVSEQFSEAALKREYPYRYCFDNAGRIMAFQDFMDGGETQED